MMLCLRLASKEEEADFMLPLDHESIWFVCDRFGRIVAGFAERKNGAVESVDPPEKG